MSLAEMLNLRPVVAGYVPGAYIRPVDDKQNPSAPVKMSTKHTPGPWRLNSDALVCGNGDLMMSIAICYDKSSAADGVSRDEMKANARLIAAAPELLAALKDTFDALLREKIAYNQRIGADYETAHKHALLSSDFAAARAAIAKATNP